MTTNRDTLLEILVKTFPKGWFKESEGFDGREGGIWTGEGSEMKDGLSMFDYWSEDYEEVIYQMGVHKDLIKILDEHGYYAEAYDPGTYMIYPG